MLGSDVDTVAEARKVAYLKFRAISKSNQPDGESSCRNLTGTGLSRTTLPFERW